MTITFEQCNKRTAELGETNDCTVKAVAIATGEGYDKAHAHLKSLGRKPRKGFFWHQDSVVGWKNYPVNQYPLGTEGYITGLHRLGYKATEVTDFDAKTVISLERDPKLAKGRYIIEVRRHALAMVDGQVIDHSKGTRRRPNKIWKIEPIETQQVAPKVEGFRKLRHRKAKRLGLDPKTGLPLNA